MMPKWSPDRTRILFSVITPERMGGIVFLNAEGTGGRRSQALAEFSYRPGKCQRPCRNDEG